MSSLAELQADTHNGSRKAPGAEQVTRLSRTEAAHKRAAQVREDWNRLHDEIERVCRRDAEAQELCLEVGTRFETVHSALTYAAHGAWLSSQDTPTRLELPSISEAPIPREGA